MTVNKKLKNWVDECAKLCKPDDIYWCNGSEKEYNSLADMLVKKGSILKLNENKRRESYYAISDPTDVARVE